jgi:hypothetical protein
MYYEHIVNIVAYSKALGFCTVQTNNLRRPLKKVSLFKNFTFILRIYSRYLQIPECIHSKAIDTFTFS